MLQQLVIRLFEAVTRTPLTFVPLEDNQSVITTAADPVSGHETTPCLPMKKQKHRASTSDMQAILSVISVFGALYYAMDLMLRALDLTGGASKRRVRVEDIVGPEADRRAFARDRAAMGHDMRKAAEKIK